MTINGKPSKVVAQPSKLGWLYVFDRATGEPIWPIEERPVPQSDVPGEKTSPTQPHPTKPPAYARNYLRVPDDLIDFTPELRQQALEVLKRYKYAPTPFNPPILGNVNGPLLGAIGPGTATNWPGSAYDPETHTVFAQAGNVPDLVALARRAAEGILRHPLRVGHRRPAVPRDLRTRRLLRGRLGPAHARRAAAGAEGAAAKPAARPRRRSWRPQASPGPQRAGPVDRQAAVRGADRRSISIAARSCGRCRTATRPTTSAITRRSRG